MPSRSKGARLWLRSRHGRTAQWVIRDGSHQKGTGCTADDIVGAERAFANYIASKHISSLQRKAAIPTNPDRDVLTIYLTDIVPHHSRPKETKGRISSLDAFFGDKMLSTSPERPAATMPTSGRRMRQPAVSWRTYAPRSTIIGARGLCNKVVEVVLPPERPPRERWLTRSEAARLIWSAWRYREVQKGRGD